MTNVGIPDTLEQGGINNELLEMAREASELPEQYRKIVEAILKVTESHEGLLTDDETIALQSALGSIQSIVEKTNTNVMKLIEAEMEKTEDHDVFHIFLAHIRRNGGAYVFPTEDIFNVDCNDFHLSLEPYRGYGFIADKKLYTADQIATMIEDRPELEDPMKENAEER